MTAAASNVMKIIVLALVFTAVFAALTAAFNVTGLLAVAIDLTPGLMGVVAILKLLDII